VLVRELLTAQQLEKRIDEVNAPRVHEAWALASYDLVLTTREHEVPRSQVIRPITCLRDRAYFAGHLDGRSSVRGLNLMLDETHELRAIKEPLTEAMVNKQIHILRNELALRARTTKHLDGGLEGREGAQFAPRRVEYALVAGHGFVGLVGERRVALRKLRERVVLWELVLAKMPTSHVIARAMMSGRSGTWKMLWTSAAPRSAFPPPFLRLRVVILPNTGHRRWAVRASRAT